MQKISSPTHLRRGFSLVEILVVIAIIAVLAAIAYPVANKMIKKGQIEKNRGIVMSLEMAIDQFYDEYGYYPFEPSTDQLTDQETIDMLNELHGGDNLAYNTKGKNYISSIPDASKNKRGGLVWSGGANPQIEAFRHTFTPVAGKSDFYIMLDSDYDEQISVTDTDYTAKDIKGKRALIWSKGEDLVRDAITPTEKNQALLDDVKNWE